MGALFSLWRVYCALCVLQVFIVGMTFVLTAASYFCMLDNGTALPPHFFRAWCLVGAICLVLGVIVVTDVPRSLGKALLVFLHRIQSPGTSFEEQVLAATIAIMVGARGAHSARSPTAFDALHDALFSH